MTSTSARRTRPARALLEAVAVAAAAVVVWFAWLGHDTAKTVDPGTGQESGPHAAWQVAGCLLCLAAVLVAAVLAGVRPWAAAAAATVAFTAVWTARAAATDDSGLFVVGAIGVFLSCAMGTAAVAYGARALATRRRR